jgi:chromosome segregation ATPase
METKSLTIEDQLAASKAILGAVQAEKAELQGAFETLAAEKMAALAEVTKVAEGNKQTVEALEQKLAGFEAEKAELQKQLAEALAHQVSASKEAAKIASSVGISPVAVSPADDLTASDSKPDAENIRKTFLGMKPGADRQAFFRKHLAILTATK